MSAIRFYGIRLILLSLFFSFYLIMIAINIDRIEEYLDPLASFKPDIVKIEEGVYVGGYPNEKVLRVLKSEKGVDRVVSLLDPHFPVTRELVAHEKQNCELLGIEFISLPAQDFPRYRDMLPVIDEILKKGKKVTYIHSYFMSDRLEKLTAALSHGARQNLQKQDTQ